MLHEIELIVNGEPYQVAVEPSESLLHVIRERLGLKGTKNGCHVGECGACTVLLDGRPIRSCLMLAIAARGKRITTIEGMAKGEELHPLQKAFVEYGAIQCGFCTPGMILSAQSLLNENSNPSDEEIKKALAGNLCRCTGYTKILEAIKAVARSGQVEGVEMKEYSVIGRPLPQVGSVPKATGSAKYIDDISLPGMLYGKILRSPYAHARIMSIDTSKAKRLSGVRAVITGKDIPQVTYGMGFEEYAIAPDKVRYVGDQVAAVAAIDEDIAEEALDLIKVTYEELPAVFDAEEAMKSGSPVIHDNAENNIGYGVTHIFGDVERGFADADYIREDRLETPMVQAAFLGARGSVADFDPTSGALTLYTEATMPFTQRPWMARVLGLPINKLRVIRPYIAGSFGNKSGLTIDVCFCSSFLSMRTGRPVKIVHTREEEFITSRGRDPVICYFKTGVKRDGTLAAMQCRQISNAGAYLDNSPLTARQNVGVFDILFRCPNVEFQAYDVYTNTLPSRTLRGLTNNALGWGQQQHMDMVARDLGMDVADFYLKNVHRKGDITQSKYKLDSCGLAECIQEVVKASNWKGKRGKLPPNRGIGLAASGHTCGCRYGAPDLSTALVVVDREGAVRVHSGRAEAGMGPGTMQIMCVAEELGLEPEDITINEFVDTDSTPFDCGNYASRGMIQQGNAAVAAAQDVRRQLFEAVARKLGVSVDVLKARDRRICVKGSPDRGISFEEAVRTCWYEGEGALPLIGRGSYSPPTEDWDLQTGEGNASIAYGFGVQAAEVEVDKETGKVKVLNVFAANDCGKVINPLILDGQSEGGISMSLGMAIFEQISYDEKGRVRETSFSNYGLPTVLQQPSVKTVWVETIDPHGPYGAKGVAEVVSLPTAPAIANAVYDAIGVRITKPPITPWKILQALKEKEESQDEV